MSFINIFNRYWPLIVAFSAIISIASSFLYQFFSLKYAVNASSEQLNQERSSMKAYVDYKEKATNIRIDDLTADVSKIHDDLTSLNTRIDSTQNEITSQIEQSRSEQNERLDQLILIMNSKRK